MELSVEGVLCIVIGIAFLVAAGIYTKRKNKGTTRFTRTMDEFDRYDAQMEQFRSNNKKKND